MAATDDITEPASDAGREPADWPGASVVVPVLNEERHLRAAVSTVLGQDYPGPLEIVLALGPSQDGTDAIAAELAAADDRVRLVANPTGATGAGLNAAVAAAQYDIVVRLDGHALVPDDYVRIAVETLQRTGADNVGGVMSAEGVTDFQRAVAAAMTSPIGVGQASFHVGGEEGPALTVYLGVFRREVLERLGGYDETFLRAQDWELNHRIRESGGVVWFTPRLHGVLPPAVRPARAGQAVPRLRPLAPGRDARARGHRQPALPGAAGGRGGGRPRGRSSGSPSGGPRCWHPWGTPSACSPGRPSSVGACRPAPGPGCPSSSRRCTGPGASASSPARAGCAAGAVASTVARDT